MSQVKLFVMLSFILMSFVMMSTPAEAVDNAFALKLGHLSFVGEDGWEEGSVLGNDSSEFNGRNYGLEWDMYTAKYFGLRFTLEYYRQNRIIGDGNYDYNDQGYHGDSRSLIMVPITVSAKWKVPTPIVSPYFYFGVGLYSWGIYEDLGDEGWFWDSDESNLRRIEEGDSIGLQVGTGVELAMGPQMAFLFEMEYRSLELDYDRYNDNNDINASSFLFSMGIMFK